MLAFLHPRLLRNGDPTSSGRYLTDRFTWLLTKIPQRQLIRVVNTRTTSRHARHLQTGVRTPAAARTAAHTALFNERHPLGPQIGQVREKKWKKFQPGRAEASDPRDRPLPFWI